MNPLNPKKLLLTKWTAVKPLAKQKHFLVSRVIQPDLPTDPIVSVEIEAVFSKAVQMIAWRVARRQRLAAGLGLSALISLRPQVLPSTQMHPIELFVTTDNCLVRSKEWLPRAEASCMHIHNNSG